MPGSTYPGPRWLNTKPPLGYGIDVGHPLARGLVFAAALNEGGGPPFELVGRKSATLGGSGVTWSSGPRGRVLKFDGTSTGYVDFGLPTDVNNAGTISAAAWVNPSLTTRGDLFAQFSDASHRWWLLTAGVTASRFSVYAAADGTNYNHVDSGSNYATGTWYLVGFSYDQTTSVLSLNVNGVAQGTATLSPGGAMGSARGTHVYLGQDDTLDGAHNFTGSLDLPLIWNRALPTADFAWLYAEPAAPFRGPNARRIFAPAAAAPTTRRYLALLGVGS